MPMKYFTFHLLLLSSTSFLVWLACQTKQPVTTTVIVPTVDTIPESVVKEDTLEEILNLDYVMGRFDPATRPDFVQIDSQYADKPGMYMRKDAYEAFKAMYRHAQHDGIQLQIKSATRNF